MQPGASDSVVVTRTWTVARAPVSLRPRVVTRQLAMSSSRALAIILWIAIACAVQASLLDGIAVHDKAKNVAVAQSSLRNQAEKSEDSLHPGLLSGIGGIKEHDSVIKKDDDDDDTSEPVPEDQKEESGNHDSGLNANVEPATAEPSPVIPEHQFPTTPIQNPQSSPVQDLPAVAEGDSPAAAEEDSNLPAASSVPEPEVKDDQVFLALIYVIHRILVSCRVDPIFLVE